MGTEASWFLRSMRNELISFRMLNEFKHIQSESVDQLLTTPRGPEGRFVYAGVRHVHGANESAVEPHAVRFSGR